MKYICSLKYHKAPKYFRRDRLNRLTVIGRIVRDAELREVGDGRIVMNNSLAIPRTYKTDNGQETDFINFVAWGKRAELIEEYCDKGNLVGLDGRIQSRNYQNEEGQTVYVVEMLVDSVHFLQPRNSNNRKERDQTVYVIEMLIDSVHILQPRNTNNRNNTKQQSTNSQQNHASESAQHQNNNGQTITEKISQTTNKQSMQS